MPIPFEVLVDDTFINACGSTELSPVENKYLLSIVNKFQDGKWYREQFENFIWNNIQETALSFKERQALYNQGNFHSITANSAINLRITEGDEKGGEIAEILLYGVMRRYYNALPVVPKIYYKQNNNDYAKGADSVHIIVEGNAFSLWLGEAKFYNSLDNDRLKKIVESVKHTISVDQIKKENSIITNISDIDLIPEISEQLREKIKIVLNRETSIDEIKPILHVPIMLLHECEITKSETHYSLGYKNSIKMYHIDRAKAYFSKQLECCREVDMYSAIKFHLILLPVPEKKEIVERFINKANVFRD